MDTWLITGGAGFIGSNFIRTTLNQYQNIKIINVDKLNQLSALLNLKTLDPLRHHFIQQDINETSLLKELMDSYKPTVIVHFAAESHVDKSILNPNSFIQSNINGTFSLLEAARAYWQTCLEKSKFRFIHISTDEVYGSLNHDDPAFDESSTYAPNSPYSASKAASDHLVRSYSHTYALPTITSNCSNNYGPYQHPEKLIPHMITNALQAKPLPIYGTGTNIRDWIYVDDHNSAIHTLIDKGIPGEKYCIGGNAEKTNLEVVNTICTILDELLPAANSKPFNQLIQFVKDRLGHDFRYAINSSKISQLGWVPKTSFAEGILKTIKWYLSNDSWIKETLNPSYQGWVEQNYINR